MKKVLYISSAVDPTRIKEIIKRRVSKNSNSLEPIAKYNNLLIDGLSEDRNIKEVTSLIGAPISKNAFSYKYFKGSKRIEGKKTYLMLGFFNFPGIKHLTIILKSLIYIVYWNIKNAKEDKVIIIDGSYYSEIIAVHIGNLFFKTPIVYSVLDVYNYMAELENTNNGSFKMKFCRKVYEKLKYKVSGFILITKQTNDLINTMNKPYVIIEGLVPYEENKDEFTPEHKNMFIYAGGLQEQYGIRTLVDAFTKIDSKYELWLFGLGNQIDYIEKVSQKHKNIFYKGSISNDELMKIEKQAFCLVNPRPTNEEYTKYSFPSKTMEYMLTGRPVLTTRLKGIPSEYDNYIYYIEDESENGIVNAIKFMINNDKNILSKKGDSARKFVLNEKNNLKQGNRLSDFLNTI